MEERKREAQARGRGHNEEFSGDNDDARSIATIVPRELGAVDGFDDEDHHQSKP